jgi:hypothetical protein
MRPSANFGVNRDSSEKNTVISFGAIADLSMRVAVFCGGQLTPYLYVVVLI